MGRSTRRRITLSERKKYRTWTVAQKKEIVLAGLRCDRSVAQVCREHQISEPPYYTWREMLFAAVGACRARRSAPSWPTFVSACVSWSGRRVASPTTGPQD